jgi:ribonuclease Z
MTWLVQARLINDPFSDPGLLIDFRFGRRAILFDLGDIHALSSREVLRITHVFVSHAHMDHFAGFDRLLRLCLGRPMPVQLVGPDGFVDRVHHKLGSYTWNLLDDRAPDFSIVALDFDGERLTRACTFRARRAFAPEIAAVPPLPPGIVLDEDSFRVRAAALDHGIACLAFAFEEKMRINVSTEDLAALGLPVGPWLNEAKRAVRRDSTDTTPVVVAPGTSVPLGILKAHVLRIAAGQRIAYVVDAGGSDENLHRIAELARHADQLFIEAAFLSADAQLAAERRHLTAAQAGAVARAAGAVRVIPFHFSPRYIEREQELRHELALAFRNEPAPRES